MGSISVIGPPSQKVGIRCKFKWFYVILNTGIGVYGVLLKME